VENFVPAQSVEEDVDVIALKERFVKKIYDDRFDAALPIVFREYKRQQAKIDGMVLEFSDWVHDINEDVYEKPTKDNQHQLQYLQELLNGAIHGGFEGKDAIDKLSDCGIGDTELENDITKYAMDHGPDADVTPLVKTWLKQYVPDLYKDLEIGQNNGRNAQTNWEQPETPEMDNHTYADGKGGEGDAGWNMTY
jgi:hypothetical protein